VRLVVATDAATAVGTQLGIVELMKTPDEERVLGHLGPDLLGDDWDPDEALHRLTLRPERPVGETLLDQTVMAGIGNIFKSEICFLRGIEPARPVGEIRDPGAIVDLARRLLLANRSTGNQVTTGDPRRGRRHWVYGRGSEPCRRCGTRIERRIDGGAGEPGERVTYWCPSCQPAEGATRSGTSPRSRTGTATRSRRPTP
jgi:endonuclease VIII